MTLSLLNDRLRESCRGVSRLWLLMISGALTGLTLVVPVIGLVEWISLIPVALTVLVR